MDYKKIFEACNPPKKERMTEGFHPQADDRSFDEKYKGKSLLEDNQEDDLIDPSIKKIFEKYAM